MIKKKFIQFIFISIIFKMTPLYSQELTSFQLFEKPSYSYKSEYDKGISIELQNRKAAYASFALMERKNHPLNFNRDKNNENRNLIFEGLFGHHFPTDFFSLPLLFTPLFGVQENREFKNNKKKYLGILGGNLTYWKNQLLTLGVTGRTFLYGRDERRKYHPQTAIISFPIIYHYHKNSFFALSPTIKYFSYEENILQKEEEQGLYHYYYSRKEHQSMKLSLAFLFSFNR